MLSPFLYSVFTPDEMAYREEVRDLAVWCKDNNLSLNVIKITGKRGRSMPPFSSTGLQWSRLRAWCPHHKQTNMVQAHQESREEGTTKPIPPQDTEKIWHGSSDPQKVLQLHHREHPDGLHHCLVRQLLSLPPQGTIEGSANSPVHHWGQASCHPLYQAVSEEGPKNGQRLQPT